MNKLLKKPTLTPDDIDQLKQRFQSLQNMAIALIETKSVDEKHATALRIIYNEAYNLLKNRQIDVDYNNMLREKRELKK